LHLRRIEVALQLRIIQRRLEAALTESGQRSLTPSERDRIGRDQARAAVLAGERISVAQELILTERLVRRETIAIRVSRRIRKRDA
jgi:hypothetical protein